MEKKRKVNIYQCDGDWCYALWVDGEYDCSGILEVPDDSTEDQVRGHLSEEFPYPVEVTKVCDVGLCQ